jgi:hypothetical protein
MEPAQTESYRELGDRSRVDGQNISLDAANATSDCCDQPHLIPPYWKRHKRDSTPLSIDIQHSPIRLEDNTVEQSEQDKALWAKHVAVDGYVIVSGAAPGIGDYVVWHCSIDTLGVSQTDSKLSSLPSGYMVKVNVLRAEYRAVVSRLESGTNSAFAMSSVFKTYESHSYSEFDQLRQSLVLAFPYAGGALPQLPPKSVICKEFLRVFAHASSDQ